MSIDAVQYAAWLKADGRAREILVEAGCNRDGVEVINYLSRFGYHTDAAETPSNAAYSARLAGGPTISRKLSISANDPTLETQTGAVEIDNLDGALDGWLGDVWEKRPITVWIGDPAWPRADFRQVFAGRIGGIQPNGRGGLRLSIYDEMARLNYPISETTVGGEGPNKDQLIPCAFGEVFNVSPVLVDEGNHEYQVHTGQIHAVLETRDIGAPVSITPTPSTGKFRLNQSAIGQICCDVQGAALGGYANTVAGLVKLLVTGYGDATLRFSLTEIDNDNFTAFDAANPAPVGLFVTDKTTVQEGARQIARSLETSLYVSREGKLRLFRLPVSTGAPAKAFTPANMDAGDGSAPTFECVEIIPARPFVTLYYARNYTPTKTGLAGGLPEAGLAILGTEWGEIHVSDTDAVALHRYTERPDPEETLLVVQADANAEAQARLARRATARQVLQFTGFPECYTLELGDTLTVIHPRFGCAAGADALVIGLDEDYWNGRAVVEVLR